jgi:hypothetical protein
MIIWTVNKPTTGQLESFLYCFRDRSFSDHLLGDCDLATLPITGGHLNLVIPRTPGVSDKLMEVWHLQVSPYYPFTDIICSPNGYTGLTETRGDTLRVRVTGFGYESISIYQGSYQSFVDSVTKKSLVSTSSLIPWFVSQPDGTKRFKFDLPCPGSKHRPLSLDQDYAPIEYLCLS